MPATGAAIALLYGYNWVSGQRLQYRTLTNTNNDHLDYTRVGMWGLGEGEVDGCSELWDSGLQRLLFTSEFADPSAFHFHSGCDAVIGSGTAPVSPGGDQNVDSFWPFFPPGVQPLHYHRIAYYALFLKILINNPPNSIHQNDPTIWADLNPVGLWRGIRCRLFDASGAMIGYGFTTNPAWHFVDVQLRRKIMPEYYLSVQTGPDDLTPAVRNRFDWPSIAAAAAYFDEILANGSRRFTGSYAFAQQTSLQAVLSQILQCCRSFMRESSGQIGLRSDTVRDTVFTLTRANTTSFSTNEVDLHSSPNRIVGKFRDLQLPSAADVVSISAPDHTSPTVTTLNPHPFAPLDRIFIGGTNTRYDGSWIVSTVPGPDANGNVYTMILQSKGSNYPQGVGAGGKIGLLDTRFKERAPEWNHHRNQYARGAVGVGIPRQRNKVKVEMDFASSTFDQVSRLARWQRDRTLGPDIAPYEPAFSAEAELPLFAVSSDDTGNLAAGIEPGDTLFVDHDLSDTYSGTYEVTKMTVQLAAVTGSGSNSLQRQQQPGLVKLSLALYNQAALYDSSNPIEAGWDIVPGSLPGNESNFTEIPLADGGALAFFSGSAASGTTIEVPSTGYNSANCLAWVSPQGFIEGNSHLHYIFDCSVSPQRLMNLTYSDGSGDSWAGDLNWAAITWRALNSVNNFNYGSLAFKEFTLLGGEKICFGQGAVATGDVVPFPPGYNRAQAFLFAYPLNARDSGNDAHGFRAVVGADGVAHHDYYDGENNHWTGPCVAFVCAVQNNRGTVSGPVNGYMSIPIPGGKTLWLGGFNILDQSLNGQRPTVDHDAPLFTVATGGKVPMPPGFSATTLQTMTGANGFQIVDHPAHGQKACYVDGDLNAQCTFEDGEGNTWFGSSGVFALLYDAPG